MLLGIGLLLTWVLIGFKIINFRNLLYCISLDFIIHTNVILKVHLIMSMYLNSRSLWLHWVHMFIPHSDVYIGVTHKHTFNLGRTQRSKLIPYHQVSSQLLFFITRLNFLLDWWLVQWSWNLTFICLCFIESGNRLFVKDNPNTTIRNMDQMQFC